MRAVMKKVVAFYCISRACDAYMTNGVGSGYWRAAQTARRSGSGATARHCRRPLLRAHLFHDHSHSHSHNHDVHGHSHAVSGGPGRSSLVSVGQSHTHSHTHNLLPTFSKRVLMRLVMAAACVLALPLWRRTSRVEVAAVGVMSLFLGAVEFSKGLVSQLRVNFGSMYLGFKAHSGAASTAISQAESSRAADGVTWAGIVVNILLASFKFFAGIYGHSAAMVADAGHSLSDLMSDGVTLWAVRMSRLPPDADHPYGHGRFEALGALIVSGMLLMAGYGIGNHSWETLGRALAAMSSSTGEVSAMLPTKITMVAALVSIILKEALYRVTAAVGMKYNSQVLIANAWHHRSDAISSVVALLAIVGARVGLPILDPIAGLLVAGMVSLTGLQVCQDSVRQLTDTMDYDIQDQVFDALTEGGGVEGVLGFDSIRARQMGPQTLVDLTIQCDYTISASAAQKAAQRVRWKILQQVPSVADVLVNIACDQQPCPVMNTLPLQSEVEASIRSAIFSRAPEIRAVPKITVHYIEMATSAEVFVQVDPKIRIMDAASAALRVRRLLLSEISSLCDVKVYLDVEKE